MPENGNAVDRSHPEHGELKTDLTVNSYHDFQRSATTAAEDFRPRTTSSAATVEESLCVVTDLRRFSHAELPRATSLLEQARAAIATCIREGITLGGVAEAQSRCEALLSELTLTSRALALTSETIEGELL